VSTDVPEGFRASDTAPDGRIPDARLPDCDCGETICLAEPVTSQCARVFPCGCYVAKRQFKPRQPREATDSEVRAAIEEVDPR
jgi:hypothetical protein